MALPLEGRLPRVLLERVFRQCGGEPAASACRHSACPAVQAGLFWAHLGLGGGWGWNECANVVILHVRMMGLSSGLVMEAAMMSTGRRVAFELCAVL